MPNASIKLWLNSPPSMGLEMVQLPSNGPPIEWDGGAPLIVDGSRSAATLKMIQEIKGMGKLQE
jgi:hypothetical protein